MESGSVHPTPLAPCYELNEAALPFGCGQAPSSQAQPVFWDLDLDAWNKTSVCLSPTGGDAGSRWPQAPKYHSCKHLPSFWVELKARDGRNSFIHTKQRGGRGGGNEDREGITRKGIVGVPRFITLAKLSCSQQNHVSLLSTPTFVLAELRHPMRTQSHTSYLISGLSFAASPSSLDSSHPPTYPPQPNLAIPTQA